MIYCVIPRELADELYDKMVDYYKDNPNVTVIVDRREGPDRAARASPSRSSSRSARRATGAGRAFRARSPNGRPEVISRLVSVATRRKAWKA